MGYRITSGLRPPWNVGMLEYWNNGIGINGVRDLWSEILVPVKLTSIISFDNPLFHHSIIPLFQRW
jgi:hypothetical protein